MNAAAGPIDITILGSGTCVPSLERSASAVLMEIGQSKLLFDSGPGTMRRLIEAGVAIYDISCLCITHFHPDHTGELASFLFAMKYPDPGRRTKPLTLIGGPGFAAFYDQLSALYRQWIHLPALSEVIELDGGDQNSFRSGLEEFDVTCARVSHQPESLAYRIDAFGGASAVFSGDTEYSENLVRLAKDADILICESALPDGFSVKGHMTPSIAAKTASEAGVKGLVLTHFYPECDHADIEGQCRKTWNGPLLLAADLMKINTTKGFSV